MAHLHRILGGGAVCWRIVDSRPGPAAQGLLSMVVVVVVVMVVVVGAVAVVMV